MRRTCWSNIPDRPCKSASVGHGHPSQGRERAGVCFPLPQELMVTQHTRDVHPRSVASAWFRRTHGGVRLPLHPCCRVLRPVSFGKAPVHNLPAPRATVCSLPMCRSKKRNHGTCGPSVRDPMASRHVFPLVCVVTPACFVPPPCWRRSFGRARYV